MDIMTDTEIADVCDRAADAIDTHGLCKHLFVNEDGAVCARGAVLAALLDRPLQQADIFRLYWLDDHRRIVGREEQVSRVVAEKLDLPRVEGVSGLGSRLAAWNNAPEREAAEVSSAFREVAAILRLKGTPERAVVTAFDAIRQVATVAV